jgi:hypothetical protein
MERVKVERKKPEDKVIKRTQVLLRRQDAEKLARLCEQSGLGACEVIRLLIKNAHAIKVAVSGKQKTPAEAGVLVSGTCKPDDQV